MQNVHFTPPEIANMLEVNVSTIKRWIDKGFLKATITAGGHRRVSKQQLALFTKDYPSLTTKSYVINRLHKQKQQDPHHTWRHYYQALLSNDGAASEKIIEQAYLINTPIPKILDTIVTPTLTHIGLEWQKGHISIYEEHKMSFLIRMHLFRLHDLIPFTEKKKPKTAILACVAQEQHEIALQMLSIVFKLHGWRVHILGINISSLELIKAAKSIQPDLIALTKIFTKSGSLDYLNTIGRYTRQHNITLLYGGSGWSKLIRERTWKNSGNIKYIASLTDMDTYVKRHITSRPQ